MRILMLGNSFTFYNNMPKLLSRLTGAEVVSHTRGGARLAEQLNPDTKMGARTLAALQNEQWDYVVLQEMSNGPITAPRSFFRSVEQLSRLIRRNGAEPVLYATWAYQRGNERLSDLELGYDEMYQLMHEACHKAARKCGILIADVGRKFYELADTQELYDEDGIHPNELGSQIAAETLAAVMRRP